MSHDIAEDEIAILPELILTNLAASSRTKVITALAMLLERHQIVKPGVASALVSRERLLPAGVATLVPVALCHAERAQIRRSALAFATLQKPVFFRELNRPGRFVSVEAVCVLAIADPVRHLHAYQRLVVLFQQAGVRELWRVTPSPGRIASVLRDVLLSSTPVPWSEIGRASTRAT
ncbi:MAG TPA: PTS sugar transporter subunit IIA [Anaerolineales bacterium]|nr:PTS sugar transporter subunit IIA [Anaerolineales bacterium]